MVIIFIMVLLIEKNFYHNFVTDLVPMKTLYLTIQEELNKIVSYYIFFFIFLLYNNLWTKKNHLTFISFIDFYLQKCSKFYYFFSKEIQNIIQVSLENSLYINIVKILIFLFFSSSSKMNLDFNNNES